MLEKTPEIVQNGPETVGLLTYLWVLGLSLLGGAAAFARKVQMGHARAWNIAEFLGEIVISAAAGMITFFMCSWSGFSPFLTAALVGIAGHMGSRAIFRLEGMFDVKFPPKKKAKDDDATQP